MKLTRAIAIAAITAAAAAAGNTYNVNLYLTSSLSGMSFQPGECKLELSGNQIVLKQGKTLAASPVQVERGAARFDSTTVAYKDGQIYEIRLGGTTTKLVLGGSEYSKLHTGN